MSHQEGETREHTRWPGYKAPQRNTWGGSLVKARNPLINPCPHCGARRYERCFKWANPTITKTLYKQDEQDLIPFSVPTLWVLDYTHQQRLITRADSDLEKELDNLPE